MARLMVTSPAAYLNPRPRIYVRPPESSPRCTLTSAWHMMAMVISAVFLDERGTVCWGDQTFALIIRDFLEHYSSEKIVTPISSSQMIEEIAEKYGGEIVYTPVGSVYVSNLMLKINAKLGGEENGGIFYAPHVAARDGGITTAMIYKIILEARKPLSRLIAELPNYYIVKDKMPCPDSIKAAVTEGIRNLPRKGKVLDIDGIKVWIPPKSWILIRPSGTEPIFRIMAEAPTKGKGDENSQRIQDKTLKNNQELSETCLTLSRQPSIALVFAVSFSVTFAATPIIGRVMRKRGITGRDVHKLERKKLPEMCGLAILIGLTVRMTICAIIFPNAMRETAAFIGTVLIAGSIGFVDDLRPLGARSNRCSQQSHAYPFCFLGIYDPLPIIPFVGPCQLHDNLSVPDPSCACSDLKRRKHDGCHERGDGRHC